MTRNTILSTSALSTSATALLRSSLFALALALPFAHVPAAIACPEHDDAAEHAEGDQNAHGKGAAAAITTATGLTIDGPWSRATATGARVAGGYVVLTNKGDKDDVLVSGSTDISEKFEVHEMAVTDGVMRMRKLDDGLAVKAGECVELKPGGYHLMFIGLKRPLAEGDTFSVDLEFTNAGKVPVTFAVRGLGARDSGHGHDHGDKAKDAAKDAPKDAPKH